MRDLKAVISTELNIEGNPIPSFIDLVLEVKPAQVTLVPDAEDAITSNAGWDTIRNRSFLVDVCGRFNEAGIRTSIFDIRPLETVLACFWHYQQQEDHNSQTAYVVGR